MFFILTAVFGTAFLAATILPLSSEVVVAAALADESIPRLPLWMAATTGNTLGAAINWGLGRYASQFRDRSWFPASPTQMDKAEAWFNRYGVWSLLMSWLPLGGDALTLIAGLLRVRFDIFLILVAIGTGARYAAVIAGVDALIF
jgi:membrane protein YqaA with SNARE-associated domain